MPLSLHAVTMSVLHIQTPLIESRALSALLGRPVWLKLENTQPSGSFKLRGIGHACQWHVRQGAAGFVSSSGGNAGLAVAYAGRKLGVPVTVVVPETATERAKELIRMEEASVIVHGAAWDQAHSYAQTLANANTPLIHPFDDPLLWEGHASLVDEVAQVGLRPDLLVCSVGGGGLLQGMFTGLDRNGWHETAVLAVETEGAASFGAALDAGHAITLPAMKTIANSLASARVCDAVVQSALSHTVRSALVSDAQALSACQRFAHDHRILVEPACGAALAALYETPQAVGDAQVVLMVVCGGVGVVRG
jgi:L-serine/L-threonine ammonia-lyase